LHKLARRSRVLRATAFVVGLMALCVSAACPAVAASPGSGQLVYVAKIEGVIDLGLAPFIERVLREAETASAAAVVLDVNTLGGRVDAAVAIRDHLLRSRVRTVAFVGKRAISAGALISLAAETLLMAPGATIGAATPVQAGRPGEGMKPVDEKTVSYVRKEFRATADARDRPGLIAEAMVDADVEIEGLVGKGKLLTLTTAEALTHKLADARAEDLAGVLRHLALDGATIQPLSENWAERVVRFLTNPVMSSLLMTIGLLGIMVELRTPGFGVPGLVGLLCLAAFFWGHSLVRLVGWEQILLVSVGLALLAIEFFLLPGFGVAGGLGLLALFAGLTSSLLGAGASLPAMVRAGARVAVSAAIAMGAALLLFRLLPVLPGGRRLVLDAKLGARDLVAEPGIRRSRVGLVGTTLTPLRPAGIAELGDERVDVVSEGEFIAAAREVEVVQEAGNRVVVRAIGPLSEKEQG
jgi:membrane-bound serine protease (ClpP class)